MANNTALLAMRKYLADLPILDRRVLHRRHAGYKDAPAIATEMQISTTHVERILERAARFSIALHGSQTVN